MEWLLLFSLLTLFPAFPSALEYCTTKECIEASRKLNLMNKDSDPCTDAFKYSCTSPDFLEELAKTYKKEKDINTADYEAAFEKMEEQKDDDDLASVGVRKLNKSCMNYHGNLHVDISKYAEKIIEGEPIEIALVRLKGPILFKTEKTSLSFEGWLLKPGDPMIPSTFLQGYKNIDPYREKVPSKSDVINSYFKLNKARLPGLTLNLLTRIYDFELKWWRFGRAKQYSVAGELVEFSMKEFLEAFSSPHWNMTLYFGALSNSDSFLNSRIYVDDTLWLFNAIDLMSKHHDLIKEYIKFAYLTRIPANLNFESGFHSIPEFERNRYKFCMYVTAMAFPKYFYARRNSTFTATNYTEWVREAGEAVKKSFYHMTDNSDVLEPFERVWMDDLVKTLTVKPQSNWYMNPALVRQRDNLTYHFKADDFVNNIIEMDKRTSTTLAEVNQGAYTRTDNQHINLQLLFKFTDQIDTVKQVAMARMIFTLCHEASHHFANFAFLDLSLHMRKTIANRRQSERFFMHVKRIEMCIRKESDRSMATASLLSEYPRMNSNAARDEIISDAIGTMRAYDAYERLGLDLLPGMNSTAEMFLKSILFGEFFCRNPDDPASLPIFFASTHPMQGQRAEYLRIFDTSGTFASTFNCKQKPRCPSFL